MKYFLFCFIVLLGLQEIIAADQPGLKFIENKNQWPSNVQFMAGLYNGKIFLTKNSFVFDLLNTEELTKAKNKRFTEITPENKINGHVYEIEFLNSNPTSVSGQQVSGDLYNFFLGANKSKWATSVNAFSIVSYKQFYANTDMIVYSEGSNLKYDFILAPHADPSRIKLLVKHAEEIKMNSGSIYIKTAAGIIMEKSPVAWQVINGHKKDIPCVYQLNDSIISYKFPKGYNQNYPLIIDPVVVACTFTGSSVACNGEASAYDQLRNGYTAGSCLSPSFPVTTGAYQTTWEGISDATINKYSSDGSQLRFSTFIGGSNMEASYCINVQKDELLLMGYTRSSDFPVSNNCFDPSYNGNTDLYFIKLDTSGSALIASTYVGGSDDDGSPGAWKPSLFRNFEFVQDSTGNIYVASASASTDFPVSPGALSGTLNGAYDAIVFKLKNDLSSLLWSTYLGGSGRDCANALRLDGTGGIYCTGTTESTDFPSTPGAISSSLAGGISDCFVSHVNATGSLLLASTYLGTTGMDCGYLLETSKTNEVYIYALQINNTAITFTPSANTFYVPNGRNFIYKTDPSLSQLLVKTRFGPTVTPNASSDYYLVAAVFQLDSCGNIYIAGDAAKNFTTTPDAIKPSTTNFDLYFCVLSPNASAIRFGSYYGGPNAEWATFGLCKIDFKGTIYYSFNGNSMTPVTANAYSQSHINGANANDHGFLKIDVGTFLTATSYSSQLNNGCAPYSISFTNQSATNNISWIFLDTPPASYTTTTATHTFQNTGIFDVILIAEDSGTCNKSDTLIQQVHVYTQPVYPLADSIPMCATTDIVLDAQNPGFAYLWSTGETSEIISAATPGNYTVEISNPGCNITDSTVLYLSATNFPFRFPNIITPNGDGINENIDLGKYSLTECELIIIDRWGRQVFQSSSPDAIWNGKVNGEVNNGTYYYTLKYKRDCVKALQETYGFITVLN